MTNAAIQQEALSRAINPLGSTANWGPIINGFIAKGIPAAEIRPRENVFTFQAWKALGRHVRKGEHGVKVCTWVPCSKEVEKSDGTKEVKAWKRPWTATVFHVSQTEPNA